MDIEARSFNKTLSEPLKLLKKGVQEDVHPSITTLLKYLLINKIYHIIRKARQ